jgi:CRP-like cAMP-binding protein
MSGYAGNAKAEPAPVKVSQLTLAEMVGTTRARVSYFMNRFRKLGFIDYNGSVQVHSKLLTFLEND